MEKGGEGKAETSSFTSGSWENNVSGQSINKQRNAKLANFGKKHLSIKSWFLLDCVMILSTKRRKTGLGSVEGKIVIHMTCIYICVY